MLFLGTRAFYRYGMTPMARLQAAALREGVDKFREEDNSVKVFEMTLRNEVCLLHQRGLGRSGGNLRHFGWGGGGGH